LHILSFLLSSFFQLQVLVHCLLLGTPLDIILFPFFEIGHIHQTLYRQCMVCLLSNDGIKIRILNTWQLNFIIWEKVSWLIKALIKEFSLCWRSLYIYFYNYLDLYELEFIWILYLKFMTVMYFILFQFMIKYFFLK